mmetsp:Transcript_137467/g.439192  ORF Transcript_137467/g.439192 Transcript_137467/m.439192 type:complete len:136 (+) Transcript_137467:1664-2071(+)
MQCDRSLRGEFLDNPVAIAEQQHDNGQAAERELGLEEDGPPEEISRIPPKRRLRICLQVAEVFEATADKLGRRVGMQQQVRGLLQHSQVLTQISLGSRCLQQLHHPPMKLMLHGIKDPNPSPRVPPAPPLAAGGK